MPAADYYSFRQNLIQSLLAFTDQQSGSPLVRRVWTREEIFDGPYMELAPDLTLELVDHGQISILNSPLPYQTRPKPNGTHRPDGVFIAKGPGIRRGQRLDKRSILDIAPILLHSLDLPIPVNMEGEVPRRAYKAATLQARPVIKETDHENATQPRGTPPPGPILDQEAQAELLRRLRSLGYVE